MISYFLIPLISFLLGLWFLLLLFIFPQPSSHLPWRYFLMWLCFLVAAVSLLVLLIICTVLYLGGA